MRPRIIILITALSAGLIGALAALAGGKDEEFFELKWGLERNTYASYRVSDVERVAGKMSTREVPDAVFGVFEMELLQGGTNCIFASGYDELPYTLLFVLPPEKVKVGARWGYERPYFTEECQGLTTLKYLSGIMARGTYQVTRTDELDGQTCLVISGSFDLVEVKEGKTLKKAPIGEVNTVSYFTIENTILKRGIFEFSAKGERLLDQHNLRTEKFSQRRQIDLKGFVKLDHEALMGRINEAIKKGLEWLKKQQRSNGSFMELTGQAGMWSAGTTALGLQALLHAGCKWDDPAVSNAWNFIEEKFTYTYNVALSLIALEARYLPFEKLEESRFIDEKQLRKIVAEKITPDDRNYMEKGVDWFVDHQVNPGSWGYPDYGHLLDHSNTQYAVLALLSAARCGAKVPPEKWVEIINHFLETQDKTEKWVELRIVWETKELEQAEKETKLSGDKKKKDKKPEEYEKEITVRARPGGWGYPARPMRAPEGAYGSMTCAALTSLKIAESQLVLENRFPLDLRQRFDTAVNEGLAWLQQNFTVRGNPPGGNTWTMCPFYYLYSLERTGVLLGIRKIGGHDWYLEGAVYLLETQKEDGSWHTQYNYDVVDTCFALLFLKKAMIRTYTELAE